jgi:hypothetical protein
MKFLVFIKSSYHFSWNLYNDSIDCVKVWFISVVVAGWVDCVKVYISVQLLQDELTNIFFDAQLIDIRSKVFSFLQNSQVMKYFPIKMYPKPFTYPEMQIWHQYHQKFFTWVFKCQLYILISVLSQTELVLPNFETHLTNKTTVESSVSLDNFLMIRKY